MRILPAMLQLVNNINANLVFKNSNNLEMFAFFKPATVASRAKKFFNYFKVK
jgi:hypothetical protein